MTCEAGVRYGDIAGDSDFGIHKRLPCFLTEDGKPKHAEACQCEKLRPPTKEEIAARNRWRKTRMDKLRAVMGGISEWRKANKGKSVSEVVECPACKGRLHLVISKINGHVRGQCETTDCVQWME